MTADKPLLFDEIDPAPRLLMGPGPINADPRVLRAMSAQLLGQFDPQFTQYMNEVMALYRPVFGTENRWTFLVDGTARAGIEAALVSLVAPGERVLVVNFGRFGLLLTEILELAAVRSGAARWQPSWTGPAVLTGAGGEPLDLARFAVLAVDPETVDDARLQLILAGVDALVADGLADPDRLGVTGGSYGGYLTNWIVGHDQRFRAAMTCRSVSDMAMLMLTGDISTVEWARLDFGATPFEDPELFQALADARELTSVEEQTPVYEDINDQIMQKLPAVPLAHPAPSLAFDARVTSYPVSPVNDEVFNMIELSE